MTAMEITGHTRLCAILADPIDHVRTPQTFNALMARWNKDVVLVPVHVKADDLAQVTAAIRQMGNLKGFIATVPHKTAMLALCDEASDAARAVGAVNAIRREADGRLVGEILDGLGFVAGLRASGVDPSGMTVFLAGAGGAANAIAFALAEAGVARLSIWNRTTDKARDLAKRLHGLYPALPVDIATADPSGADLVVNATSLGLRPDDPLPLDAARLAPSQIVAEIIMKPEMTALLIAARNRDCRICLGAPMLDCQLELMAEFMGVER